MRSLRELEGVDIRLMLPSDADAVRQVYKESFAALYRERGLSIEPIRTRANMLWNLAKAPGGCFVAVCDGKIIGYVFSHTWGCVGWTGPLGVTPPAQGLGVGKRLLHLSAEYLKQQGCRYIGLETMPNHVVNLGLYLSYGYRLGEMVLRWQKELSGPRHDGEAVGLRACWLSDLTPRDRSARLEFIRRLGDRVLPGTDLTVEADLMLEHEQGDVLLLSRARRLAGVALVQTEPLLEDDDDRSSVYIVAMLLEPGLPMEDGTAVLEGQLYARGYRGLLIGTDDGDGHIHHTLLRLGYRVGLPGIRFLLGESPRPAGTVCWRWAG